MGILYYTTNSYIYKIEVLGGYAGYYKYVLNK